MENKKIAKDFRMLCDAEPQGSRFALLRLATTDGSPLLDIIPGAFVQIAVDVPGVLLRRPISINNVDRDKGELWLLVRDAGAATHRLVTSRCGDIFNIILPLGNGFTLPEKTSERVLLVGGGVGVAPMLYLGKMLCDRGLNPVFLQGARTGADLLQTALFSKLGRLETSTDDGTVGHKGVVTTHPVFEEDFDRIYCCGPAPMMKGVAAIGRRRGIITEVSLENMMACGLGACLCCVEKTVKGNVCVCSEGPVFNINELTWQI